MTEPITTERLKEMSHRLREPVDQGGYDGRYPDAVCISAAEFLDQLWSNATTEQEMHAAWRKRAEEAESELLALRARVAAKDDALEWAESFIESEAMARRNEFPAGNLMIENAEEVLKAIHDAALAPQEPGQP